MDKNGNDILKETNAFIKEQVNALTIPQCEIVEFDVRNFETPNFNKLQDELLKEFNSLFKPLTAAVKNKPCLYFFEILEGNIESIIEFYENLDKKNKSALKKRPYSNTTCLYVGRSKRNLEHRIKVHFGYRDTTEKGLQLLHRAKPLNLKLKLTIYIFPEELHLFLPFYEARFSAEYKPLLVICKTRKRIYHERQKRIHKSRSGPN